eukprot:Awhi_evm1s11680
MEVQEVGRCEVKILNLLNDSACAHTLELKLASQNKKTRDVEYLKTGCLSIA